MTEWQTQTAITHFTCNVSIRAVKLRLVCDRWSAARESPAHSHYAMDCSHIVLHDALALAALDQAVEMCGPSLHPPLPLFA